MLSVVSQVVSTSSDKIDGPLNFGACKVDYSLKNKSYYDIISKLQIDVSCFDNRKIYPTVMRFKISSSIPECQCLVPPCAIDQYRGHNTRLRQRFYDANPFPHFPRQKYKSDRSQQPCSGCFWHASLGSAPSSDEFGVRIWKRTCKRHLLYDRTEQWKNDAAGNNFNFLGSTF